MLKRTLGNSVVQALLHIPTLKKPIAHVTADANLFRTMLLKINGGWIMKMDLMNGHRVTRSTTPKRILS